MSYDVASWQYFGVILFIKITFLHVSYCTEHYVFCYKTNVANKIIRRRWNKFLKNRREWSVKTIRKVVIHVIRIKIINLKTFIMRYQLKTDKYKSKESSKICNSKHNVCFFKPMLFVQLILYIN